MAKPSANSEKAQLLDVDRVIAAVKAMEPVKDGQAELLEKLFPVVLEKLRQGFTRKAIQDALIKQGVKMTPKLSGLFVAARTKLKGEQDTAIKGGA